MSQMNALLIILAGAFGMVFFTEMRLEAWQVASFGWASVCSPGVGVRSTQCQFSFGFASPGLYLVFFLRCLLFGTIGRNSEMPARWVSSSQRLNFNY
jgi:hypothetical protein